MTLGQPRVLFQRPFRLTLAGAPNYDVPTDGSRFLMIEDVGDARPSQINVVLNWSEEFERLPGAGLS